MKTRDKYRVHRWLNTETLTPLYGVQINVPTTRKWLHLCADGEPLLFKTEAEAIEWIKGRAS